MVHGVVPFFLKFQKNLPRGAGFFFPDRLKKKKASFFFFFDRLQKPRQKKPPTNWTTSTGNLRRLSLKYLLAAQCAFYRYFETPSCTFENFHHIFISHTYRTMKSSFSEFREKVEGGYQNTCKSAHLSVSLLLPRFIIIIPQPGPLGTRPVGLVAAFINPVLGTGLPL